MGRISLRLNLHAATFRTLQRALPPPLRGASFGSVDCSNDPDAATIAASGPIDLDLSKIYPGPAGRDWRGDSMKTVQAMLEERFFGRFVGPPIRRENHASPLEGIPKAKSQASDVQNTKTLQSGNSPQAKSRFPISGLDLVHGRPDSQRAT